MQLSRQLAGFSCEESERLRKAMGKLKREEIDALKPLFIEGGKKNGHNPRILEKIWRDWEKKFGLYAFCKSHAVCYTWLAYQTAYLKAHYPVEYMSALRSCRK
jgi:DNA polymerase-3 subunit alpha